MPKCQRCGRRDARPGMASCEACRAKMAAYRARRLAPAVKPPDPGECCRACGARRPDGVNAVKVVNLRGSRAYLAWMEARRKELGLNRSDFVRHCLAVAARQEGRPLPPAY